MFKKLTAVLVAVVLVVLSFVPAYAAGYDRAGEQKHGWEDVQKSVIYQREIKVTEKGGVFQIGFVTVKFPKNFIYDEQLPIKIKVEISAVNGVPGIEFSPDIHDFNKDVTVIVHPYRGLLYDKSSGINIPVKINNQKLYLEHFSRYAFS